MGAFRLRRSDGGATLRGAYTLRGLDSTQVGLSVDLRWQVRDRVGQDLAALWVTRVLGGASTEFLWSARQAQGHPVNLGWVTRVLVGDSVEIEWNTRERVAATVELGWAVAGGFIISPVALSILVRSQTIAIRAVRQTVVPAVHSQTLESETSEALRLREDVTA